MTIFQPFRKVLPYFCKNVVFPTKVKLKVSRPPNLQDMTTLAQTNYLRILQRNAEQLRDPSTHTLCQKYINQIFHWGTSSMLYGRSYVRLPHKSSQSSFNQYYNKDSAHFVEKLHFSALSPGNVLLNFYSTSLFLIKIAKLFRHYLLPLEGWF